MIDQVFRFPQTQLIIMDILERSEKETNICEIRFLESKLFRNELIFKTKPKKGIHLLLSYPGASSA